MAPQIRCSNHFIYFTVAAVNLISFTSGGCFSWASPMLPKLSSTNSTINPLPMPITTFEQSWIVANMNLGAVIGPLFAGIFSEKFGKKNALLLLGLPMVVSHLLCAVAVNVYVFMAARFLIGLGVGTVYGIIPGYISDIAEDGNRGFLGSILGLSSCAGSLFMYVIGPFLSVSTFSLINLIPMILFYALFGCCTPDNPYDLVRRGNQKAARKCLMTLRNKTSKQIEKELVFIIESIKEGEGLRKNSFLSLFKSKAVTKGLIISNCTMFFQQFSGICAVAGYMQIIFEAADSSIPSVYSAMVVGVIQLVANIVSGQLVDRAGRKVLLIVSYMFSMVSLVSLGLYFYLKESGKNVDQIAWLPIVSLVIYVSAFNFGMNNIPWVLVAELFPANIKALALTITSFFVFSLSFIVTMCFPYLSIILGMARLFWIFAVILVAGTIFTTILIPETKGKSIQEIQNILEGTYK